MTAHQTLGGMTELRKRVMVAAIGLPAIGAGLSAGVLPTAVLLAMSAAIGCWEYERLVFGSVPRVAWIGVFVSGCLPLVPALFAVDRAGLVLFGLLAAASMLTWIVHLFDGPRASAPGRIGHILGGILFSSVGLVALSGLRAGPDGVVWVVVVLASTWGNDTGAYLVGKKFGRRLLWPEITPHKTWEGFAGGLGAGILALLVARRWFPSYLTIGACIGLGALAGLFGPLGDLCKSMLKRACNAKDSGRLLPGHGGMLDRIDGVLFVAPVVWVLRFAIWPR